MSTSILQERKKSEKIRSVYSAYHGTGSSHIRDLLQLHSTQTRAKRCAKQDTACRPRARPSTLQWSLVHALVICLRWWVCVTKQKRKTAKPAPLHPPPPATQCGRMCRRGSVHGLVRTVPVRPCALTLTARSHHACPWSEGEGKGEGRGEGRGEVSGLRPHHAYCMPLRQRMEGPCSWYSALDIHSSWCEPRLPRMDAPSHTPWRRSCAEPLVTCKGRGWRG